MKIINTVPQHQLMKASATRSSQHRHRHHRAHQLDRRLQPFHQQPASPRHRESSRLQPLRAPCWYSSSQGDKQGHRQAFVSEPATTTAEPATTTTLHYLGMGRTSCSINLVFSKRKATASARVRFLPPN